MKSHKPFPLPSLHLRPLSICHPFSILGHWSVSTTGLTRPSFIPGEMGCSWAAPGVLHLSSCLLIHLTAASWDWTHSLPTPLLFFITFLFSQRLCRALPRRGTFRFTFSQTGIEVISATRWSLSSAILSTLSRKNEKKPQPKHSVFGSQLIFESWWKFLELSPQKRLNILKRFGR